MVVLGSFGTIQRNRDWQSWEKLLKAALRVNENHSFAWTELGSIAFDKDDEKTARRYWKKALEVDPRDRVARANLAMSYVYEGEELIKQKQVEKGEALYEKAMDDLKWSLVGVDASFKRGPVYVCMATIHRHRGERDTAKKLLGKAIEADKSYLQAYMNLVELLQRGGAPERLEAIEVILKAHQLKPEDTQIARKAAGMLLEVRRPYDALELLVQTINVLTPGTPERQEIERLATELKNKLNEARRRGQPR